MLRAMFAQIFKSGKAEAEAAPVLDRNAAAATKQMPETGSPPTESLAAAANVSTNGTPQDATWNHAKYLKRNSCNHYGWT